MARLRYIHATALVLALSVLAGSCASGAFNGHYDKNGVPNGYLSYSWMNKQPLSHLYYPGSKVVIHVGGGGNVGANPALAGALLVSNATGAEIYSWYTKKLASMGWKFGNDNGCPDWAVTCPQYYHAGHGHRELFVIAIDDPTSDPFGIPPSKIPPACTVYDMSYQIFSPGGTSVNIPSMGWNGGTQCWWTKKGWRFPPDAVDAAM